jgi:hypothetical protein
VDGWPVPEQGWDVGQVCVIDAARQMVQPVVIPIDGPVVAEGELHIAELVATHAAGLHGGRAGDGAMGGEAGPCRGGVVAPVGRQVEGYGPRRQESCRLCF